MIFLALMDKKLNGRHHTYFLHESLIPGPGSFTADCINAHHRVHTADTPKGTAINLALRLPVRL
jgi:hypothetical protein